MPGDAGDVDDEGIDDVGTAGHGDDGGTNDEDVGDVAVAAPMRLRCLSRMDSLLESFSIFSAMLANGFM